MLQSRQSLQNRPETGANHSNHIRPAVNVLVRQLLQKRRRQRRQTRRSRSVAQRWSSGAHCDQRWLLAVQCAAMSRERAAQQLCAAAARNVREGREERDGVRSQAGHRGETSSLTAQQQAHAGGDGAADGGTRGRAVAVAASSPGEPVSGRPVASASFLSSARRLGKIQKSWVLIDHVLLHGIRFNP